MNGRLGYGVKKINEIPYCDKQEWIIQKYLKDCDSDSAQHYRIITLYNKLYLIYKLTAPNINIIASNHGQGAKVKLLYYKKEIEYLDKNIYNICNQLLILHKKEFLKCFSIGWDVVLHCDKFNNKIPYVLEGNLMHSVWFDFDKKFTKKDKELIDDYKKECLIFLKDNKYL